MQKLSIVAAGICAAAISFSVQAAASAPAPVHGKTIPVKAVALRRAPVKIAPADEYFGRMKMSILGISNTIRDTGLREGFDPPHASNYYGGLMLAQDALRDWSHKYPGDSWIPHRAYDMSHDFWLMRTPQGNAAAESCRAILFKQFPHDRWTSLARRETALSVAPPIPTEPVAASTAVPQTH